MSAPQAFMDATLIHRGVCVLPLMVCLCGHMKYFLVTRPAEIAEAGDLDRDGTLDVVAIDETQGVTVHFGKGDGAFAAPIGGRESRARWDCRPA